jgi:hypothetical protein
MTTAYTSLLGLALPVTGELSGTWGDTVNNSITSLLDSAIAGTTTLSADTTLTTTTGASNQARQAILLCTGHSANITITAPAQSKIYTVINASATYTVKIRGAGPTTGITIPISSTATVAWNGSDFVDATNYINGNITLGSGTINGVAYLNGSKVLTTGSALVFDGTVLTLGTSSAFPLTGSKLSIGNDANSALRLSIANQNAGASSLVGIDFQPAGGAWKIDVPADTSGFVPPMYFKAGASTNVTFAYGGNVGIGTSSPSYKLDVRGSGNIVSWSDGTTPGTLYSSGGYVGLTFPAGTGGFFINTAGNFNTISTNGVERVRVDSSGNLGLGVTPSAWRSGDKVLDVGETISLYYQIGDLGGITNNQYINTSNARVYKKNGYANMYLIGDSGTHKWFNAASGTAGNAITFTQAMTLDTSGNLSIGATSTTGRLLAAGTGFNILGNAYGVASFLQDTTTARGVFMGYDSTGQIGTVSASSNGAASNLAFWTYSGSAWAEKARIDSSGDLLVGTTTAVLAGKIVSVASGNQTAIAARNGTATYAACYAEHTVNSSTGYAAYFTNTGSSTGLYISNTAAWQSTSDERLKTDIKTIDSTARLLQLRPVDYLWKSQLTSDEPNKRNLGFIAQEVKEVFPELVGVAPDGMFSVEYTGLIAPLVKAIQEQQALITQLTARITALEGA